MWNTASAPACAAIILGTIVEPVADPRVGETERPGLVPGQSLNETLSEAAMIPIRAVVPGLPSDADLGLPADSLVSVLVRVAVDRDGQVVDAEPQPAALLRVRNGSSETYPGADLSIEQARSFEAVARRGILSSWFAVDPAVRFDRDFVRGAVRVSWLVSGETEFVLSCTDTVQRSEQLLLSEGCSEPTLISSLRWTGPQRGEFRRISELSAQELESARGIPAGRRIPTGDRGCGLLEGVPPNLPALDADELVRGALITETQVPPEYPPELRRLKIAGTVALFSVIDEDGAVVGFLLNRATPGFPEFLQSVMDAACQWRYEPSTINGTPTISGATVHVQFVTL